MELFSEYTSPFGFTETETLIAQAASKAGWKMPAIHNLQETMSNNGFNVLPVKVLELCKPQFAYQILKNNTDRILSTMMPCRISIYEKADGKTYVSKLNANALSAFFEGAEAEYMSEADNEMNQLIKTILK